MTPLFLASPGQSEDVSHYVLQARGACEESTSMVVQAVPRTQSLKFARLRSSFPC